MKKYKWNKAKFAINILKLESITALALVYDVMFIAYLLKQEGIEMEFIYKIGDSKISSKDLKEQTDEILNILKKRKQTYAVNKFVLERTIDQLKETVIQRLGGR